MLYGAAYYHEYQPYERLEDDIRLMRAANLTLARVGESTWSTWEPEEGRFELAWMERILDALHAAGIKVIFGTPTYAIPPWLARKHPEVMAQYLNGRRAYYGARQNMDFTHPAYRYYAERVIRTLVAHFAPHPAIIGYQLDNETGSGPELNNPGVFQGFIDYLKAQYGTIERLNEVWGLTYWSHRLGDWSDLWTADGNTTPGYDLAWRRYQAALVAEFLAWQAAIVREYARPDQFVTQDLVGGHGKLETDRYAIAQVMDISAENPYYMMQDGLLALRSDAPLRGSDWAAAGPASLWLKGDLGYGAKRSNFLITETNASSTGWHDANYPAYDGQWRLAAYTFIARGANLISYWHWHTLHYGAETYWGGVLGHDLEPNRMYHEVSRIGAELRQHDALLTDLAVEADVALLYSQDSRYALEFQPCLHEPGKLGVADRASYQRIFDTFYHAFFDAGAQTAIVYPQQRFEDFPVLVVPALYIADDALLDRLARYAEAGGQLVLSFRSGYADEFARARWTRAPGPLRTVVGASYQEYSNLIDPLPLRSGSEAGQGSAGFTPPAEAGAEAWADGLLLEGATPLAYYDHPHFGRFPAIVTQPFGKGRVTYVGTLPNAALGQALAAWVMRQASLPNLMADAPAPVRISAARATSGQRLWFVSNWSWEPQTVTALPATGRELFTGEAIGAGDALALGPWDVKILVAESA